MPAECWAHAVGVVGVASNGPSAPNPLGACFECGVFGCSEHAERDTGSGKWLCFQSVANATAASAGIGELIEGLEISSSEEFERRFPVLAGATYGLRHAARETFESQAPVKVAGGVDLNLLADAVGVAQALMGVEAANAIGAGTGDTAYSWAPARTELVPDELFARPFADLLDELRQ